MKGRPADPTRARRRTGNHPVRSDTKLAPLNAKFYLEPPADAPEELAQLWSVVIQDLSQAGHLRSSDLPLVSAYCEAAYAHVKASENVHQYGVLVKGPGGPIANPMLKIQKDAAATMRQLSDVLGLNPLARIRAGLMEVAGASMVNDLRDRLVAKLAGS